MGRSNSTGQQPMLKSSIRLPSMLESTKSKSNFQIKTKRFQETSASVADASDAPNPAGSSTDEQAQTDDSLVPWTSIVEDHGWAMSGHIAGPDASSTSARRLGL